MNIIRGLRVFLATVGIGLLISVALAAMVLGTMGLMVLMQTVLHAIIAMAGVEVSSSTVDGAGAVLGFLLSIILMVAIALGVSEATEA